MHGQILLLLLMFQFTHPGRGATLEHNFPSGYIFCFNSRTPGGVRPTLTCSYMLVECFNSRTPGGVRLPSVNARARDNKFQFTHPGRGATFIYDYKDFDLTRFNSRTPGGVRPLGGATYAGECGVSIHAPREGCDSVVQSCVLWGG